MKVGENMKTQEHFRGKIIRRFMAPGEFVEFNKRYNQYKIRELGREFVESQEKANKFDF